MKLKYIYALLLACTLPIYAIKITLEMLIGAGHKMPEEEYKFLRSTLAETRLSLDAQVELAQQRKDTAEKLFRSHGLVLSDDPYRTALDADNPDLITQYRAIYLPIGNLNSVLIDTGYDLTPLFFAALHLRKFAIADACVRQRQPGKALSCRADLLDLLCQDSNIRTRYAL